MHAGSRFDQFQDILELNPKSWQPNQEKRLVLWAFFFFFNNFIITFSLAAGEDAAVPSLLAYVRLNSLLFNDFFEELSAAEQ